MKRCAVSGSEEGAAKRGRGRPRLVSREKIIQAARHRDPATLTMQSLAEEIGVDRKTLHYHVESRDSLLKLVAADAFRDAVASHDFTPGQDWRSALLSFAYITRDAVISAGAWASYVRFETEEDLEAVRPAEAAAVALVDAGLADIDAGRVISMVAELAFAAARTRSDSAETGVPPQDEILEQALGQADDDRFALTRRLLGEHSHRARDGHFSFELEVVALGVERLIARA